MIFVDYPDLSSISNNSNIGSFLSLPNSSYPFFWTWLIFGIFVILTLSLYFKEKAKIGKGNLLSSAAVSSLAIVILATLGSLIGLFTIKTLIPIIVMSLVIIIVWIFSKK